MTTLLESETLFAMLRLTGNPHNGVDDSLIWSSAYFEAAAITYLAIAVGANCTPSAAALLIIHASVMSDSAVPASCAAGDVPPPTSLWHPQNHTCSSTCPGARFPVQSVGGNSTRRSSMAR